MINKLNRFWQTKQTWGQVLKPSLHLPVLMKKDQVSFQGNRSDRNKSAMDTKLQQEIDELLSQNMDSSQLLTSSDGHNVSIHSLENPTFRHYRHQFEEGAYGPPSPLSGIPGTSPGVHSRQPWRSGISISQVMDQLLEELGLPALRPKTDTFQIEEKSVIPHPIKRRRGGINVRATLKNAFKNSISQGKPFHINMDTDLRFNTVQFDQVEKPRGKALIIYAMDYSGSMDRRLQRVKDCMWFFSNFIKYKQGLLLAEQDGAEYSDEQYFGKGVQEVFLLQDTMVTETDYQGFINTKANGGTVLNVVYNAGAYIMGLKGLNEKQNYTGLKSRFDLKDYNVYLVHFTDCETEQNDIDAVRKQIESLLGQGINLVATVHTTEDKKSRNATLQNTSQQMAGYRYSFLPNNEVNSIKLTLRDLLISNPDREAELEAKEKH